MTLQWESRESFSSLTEEYIKETEDGVRELLETWLLEDIYNLTK